MARCRSWQFLKLRWYGRDTLSHHDNCTDTSTPPTDYHTYSLPLDKSWTLADAPVTAIGRHDTFSYENAALWPTADGTSFYSYSKFDGWYTGCLRHQLIHPFMFADGGVSWATQLYGWPSLENWYWQFTPDDSGGGGGWETVAPPQQSNFSLLSRSTSPLYASGNGLGFALGGTEDTQTNYGLYQSMDIQGLVMYNDSSQEWWNFSSKGYSYSGTATNGAGHFVPTFGPEGLLFLFGGYANGRPAPFDYVYMFEPVLQQWRKQEVTGSPPPPVTVPCVVGLEGDNDTYEVSTACKDNPKLSTESKDRSISTVAGTPTVTSTSPSSWDRSGPSPYPPSTGNSTAATPGMPASDIPATSQATDR